MYLCILCYELKISTFTVAKSTVVDRFCDVQTASLTGDRAKKSVKTFSQHISQI